MNQNFKLILIIAFLTFKIDVFGQFNYKAGYIITLENDTIFGKINDGGGIRNSKICLFKEVKVKKVTKYQPGQIKAYRFIGDKYYCSQQVFYEGTFKSVFLEVLIDGSLNLYYNWQDKDMSFYIEKEDGLLVGLINMEFDTKNKSDDGKLVYSIYDDVKIPVYKDTLALIFRESKKIQNQIFNIEYNSKSLLAISTEYINETCNSNKCINYSKDLRMYKPKFGIYSGIQFNKITILPNIKQYNESTSIFQAYPIGIFFNFPLPLINDRLSFQFELSSTSFDFNQSLNAAPTYLSNLKIQSRTLGIPFLFKYEIKRKKVSPSLAIGKSNYIVLNSKVTADYLSNLSLHSIQKAGLFFELGLDYRLINKISIFCNLRVESFKNIVITGINHSSYRTIYESPNYQFDYKTYSAALNIGLKF